MKKLLIIPLLFCTGCVANSDAYYQAQTAMWQAKQAASIAWATRANQPLATITAKSGEVISIANPIQVQPMAIHAEPNAWVEAIKTVVNSTPAGILAGGWAVNQITENMQGNTYSSDGDMSVTRDSGNSTNLTSNTVDSGSTLTHQDYVDSGNTDRNDVVDSHNTQDSHDSTATPTVVNPVVVDPVVVSPEVIVTNGS